GFAALVSADPDRDAIVRRMVSVLLHRGPDDEGLYVGERIALGHRRLAIIDIEGGTQPLQSADGTIALVANGEIYNYRELRRGLERDGHVFLTQSDCEVIIALYQRHGEALFEHLRGMFSFALWDASRQRLIAARDHLG